jgi:ubiquinone/menaquinone biosynthesis C-methylase UbiE
MTHLWDTLARNYDTWYETSLGAFALEAEIAALLTLAGDLTMQRGLEVGCGTGQFGKAFARHGAWMVGVDHSAAMLEVAAKNSKGRLALCHAEGERLPFAAHSFEAVLAVTVLEFVTNPQEMLTEMWRVLQPGGRMLLGVLNSWSLWALERRLRRVKAPYAQAHFYSPPELVRLLNTFAPTQWLGTVFLPPWTKGQRKVWWPLVENIGIKLIPMFGAFLAAVTQKS